MGEAIATLISTGTSAGLTALIIIALTLISAVVKFWNWSKETSAQGLLYQQLSEMVQKQRQELDTMYSERLKLQELVFELRSKIEHLESCEGTTDLLKKRLDLKDQIIAERDIRITNLLEDLMKMKERVHQLEMRIMVDEEKFCQGCSFKTQTLNTTLQVR